MDFLSLAKNRFSARKFVSGTIPQEDIDKIIEAGLCAPTAVNFQPFKIWAFESAEAKEKLLSCTKMKFIEPAPVIFAVGANAGSAWVRPFDKKNFADIDAAIVATQMMLAIHDLGYGSTWIGHFDADSLKKLFPEMDGYEMIALLPVGIMAENCVPSDRHTISKSRDELVKIL